MNRIFHSPRKHSLCIILGRVKRRRRRAMIWDSMDLHEVVLRELRISHQPANSGASELIFDCFKLEIFICNAKKKLCLTLHWVLSPPNCSLRLFFISASRFRQHEYQHHPTPPHPSFPPQSSPSSASSYQHPLST